MVYLKIKLKNPGYEKLKKSSELIEFISQNK